MATTAGMALRLSRTDDSPQSRFSTDVFGATLSVPQPSTELRPPAAMSNVFRHFTHSSAPKTKAEQSGRTISRYALNSLESGATQDADRHGRTSYGNSSGSPSALHAMLGLEQTIALGTGTVQEGFDPIDKGREEENSASSRYGEADGNKGDRAMGASSESGVDATLRHHGETLERLERKVDSNHESTENKIEEARREQRGEFKWLIGLGFGAFVAILGAIVGTPYVMSPPASVAPASVIPQKAPGGYTLTVHPDPGAQTSDSSN